MDEQEEYMNVIIKRLINGRLTAGLRTWSVNVATMKRQEVLLVKVISRMGRAQLWKGFGKWKTNTLEAEKELSRLLTQKRCIKKVLSKMAHGKTSAAFTKWVCACDYAVIEEGLMKRVLNRVIFSSLAKGFDAWSRFVETVVQQEEQMIVVIKKLTHGHLAAGLRAWTAAVAAMQREHSLLTRVCCRMFRAQLWKGFGKWKANAAGAEKLGYRQHEEKRTMLKIMSRIKNGRLSSAWTSWVVYVDFTARGQLLMKRTLQRIRRSASWKGFSRWRQVVELLRKEAKILKKVVLRIRNAFMLKGFRTWVVFTRQHQDQEQRLTGVLGRMGKSLLWAAYSKWATVVKHGQDEDRFLLKIILRMQNSVMVSAYRKWNHVVQFHKHQEKLMKTVINRLARGMIWKGYRQWVTTVRWMEQEETNNEQKGRLVRKTVAKMQYSFLSSAWRSWMLATFAGDPSDMVQADLSNFVSTMALGMGSVAKIQVSRKFSIWKKKWIEFNAHVEGHRRQALAQFEMAIVKVGRSSLHSFFHRWHTETVSTRMEEGAFDTIVSKPTLLLQKMEESPGLLGLLINKETMSKACMQDTNLLAKMLSANEHLCCPECDSATTNEFVNKNGFEYPGTPPHAVFSHTLVGM
jgi:hypothetical protein